MVSKRSDAPGVPGFQRPMAATLRRRLAEPRRFVQVVTGPRQVGKTTLVQGVAQQGGMPFRYASADEPTLRDGSWVAEQWEAARLLAREGRALLILDEVQKAPRWSESVKRLWDEDTRRRLPLRVVLLGSAPLLVQQGLTESLAGRFETLHLPHWSFAEMREAFGFTMDDFIYFGGYPGAAALVREPERWRRYVLDSLIEPTISRDVLLMTRVDKPALLRQLFDLGCRYSGQVLSYTKMLGQLQDAGNTTTLAHYLTLLSQAGMLTGLSKYSARGARQRGSSPKLQVLNTALMSAVCGLSPQDARKDTVHWGRLTESAVGAHLANWEASGGGGEVSYWREGDAEVDFVLRAASRLVAIEVKSSRAREGRVGNAAFLKGHRSARSLLVGADGVSMQDFLTTPPDHWTRD